MRTIQTVTILLWAAGFASWKASAQERPTCQGVSFELVGHGFDADEMKEALEADLRFLSLREAADSAIAAKKAPVAAPPDLSKYQWERYKFRIREVCQWAKKRGADRLRFECRLGSSDWQCSVSAQSPNGEAGQLANNLYSPDGNPIKGLGRPARVRLYSEWLATMINVGGCQATGLHELRGLPFIGMRMTAKTGIRADRFGTIGTSGGNLQFESAGFAAIISPESQEMEDCTLSLSAPDASPSHLSFMSSIPQGTVLTVARVELNGPSEGLCSSTSRNLSIFLEGEHIKAELTCKLQDLDHPIGGNLPEIAQKLFDISPQD